MSKSLVSIYKIPILMAIVLIIIMLALSGARAPYDIASIITGVFLGMLILDMEYVLDAVFLDTKTDFSQTLAAYLRHNDWNNALKHIYYHRDEFKEKSLNSAIFQIVLALMSIFVVYATHSIFAKALILATFANSIYILFEYYFKDRTDDWFWAFTQKPTRQGIHAYIFVLILILSYSLYIFGVM